MLSLTGSLQAVGQTIKTERTTVTSKTVKVYDHININEKRLLVLRDDVDEVSTDPLVVQMIKFDKENKDPIYLVINTNGGSVEAGLNLINTMEAIKSPTVCLIDSKAYSMGAIIAAFCDKTYIHRFASTMFHYASYGVKGPENIVPRRVDFIRKDLLNMHAAVAKQLGLTTETYLDKIKDEWWMTAQETVEAGLADGIVNKLTYPFEEKKPFLPFFLFGEDDKDIFDVRMERNVNTKGN